MGTRDKIENEILSVTLDLLVRWKSKFDGEGISIAPLSIRRGGEGESYFSEIEVIFEKNNEIETIFSMIIFMEGKLFFDIEQAHEYINNEIMLSYEALTNLS